MYLTTEILIIGVSIFLIIFCVCDYIACLIFDRFIRPKFFRGDK